MYIDDENRFNAVETFKKTWEEFRQALGQNIIDYKDLDKAREYTFLKVLEGVLQYEDNNDDIQEKFNSLYFNYSFCRATKKNENETKEDMNYERFLPKEEFITKDNRFSPKGIEYLYLACKPRFGKERNYNYIEEIALKEVRAEKNKVYGICKFRIPEEVACLDRSVINLTIADNKSYEEIDRDFCEKSDDYLFSNLNEFLTIKNKVKKGELSKYTYKISRKFCLQMYFKILSSELFKPVENAISKEFQYAPFHCLAYYFKVLGYDGIIYKSTVCNNGHGKDIVLFDKMLAKPFNEIRFVDYKNRDVEID